MSGNQHQIILVILFLLVFHTRTRAIPYEVNSAELLPLTLLINIRKRKHFHLLLWQRSVFGRRNSIMALEKVWWVCAASERVGELTGDDGISPNCPDWEVFQVGRRQIWGQIHITEYQILECSFAEIIESLFICMRHWIWCSNIISCFFLFFSFIKDQRFFLN